MDADAVSQLTTTTGIKGNIRCITFSDNEPAHWEELIKITKANYQNYYYIYHDKDLDENGNLKKKHLHIVAFDKGGTSFKAHCSRYESVIPANMIRKVRSPRAIVRYLTHKDSPNKAQYDEKEVFTNSLSKYRAYLRDEIDDLGLYENYMLLKSGKISVGEFLEIYRSELATLNFYQKCQLFKTLNQY